MHESARADVPLAAFGHHAHTFLVLFVLEYCGPPQTSPIMILLVELVQEKS